MKSELTTSIPVRFFQRDRVTVQGIVQSNSVLPEAAIWRVAAALGLPLLTSGKVNIFQVLGAADARDRVLASFLEGAQLIQPVPEIAAQTSLNAAMPEALGDQSATGEDAR